MHELAVLPRSGAHEHEPRLQLLVADGDRPARSLLASWAREVVEGIAVLEAADGSEAIQLGLQRRPHLALLEVDLPRVGGVEAAVTLRHLQPEMRVALLTADPPARRARAHGHRLPVFDKAELDHALAWVHAQLQRYAEEDRSGRERSTKRSLACAVCGYGVFRSRPPERCPMCQAEQAWLHAPRRPPAVLTARPANEA